MKTSAIVLSMLSFGVGTASAAVVQLEVTVTNRAHANGVAVSPVTVAFHDGSYSAFSSGAAASVGVQNIAESGNGAPYRTAFAASNPLGVSGVVTATSGGFGPGIFLPGATGSQTFTLDTAANSYFNFGAMVVPSNDRFIGNGNGVRLFDGAGVLQISTLTLHGSDVWDAGTEVDGPFGAAFLAGQSGGDHVAQNGVIGLNRDFSAYAGLTTAAGYAFDSALGASDSVAEISFRVVPAPGASAAIGLAGVFTARRRRR